MSKVYFLSFESLNIYVKLVLSFIKLCKPCGITYVKSGSFMDRMVNLTKMLKFKNQNNPKNKENLTIHPNFVGSLHFNSFISTTFLSIVMK